MQRINQPSLRQFLISNLMWFLASLGLAFIVWLIASNQADPVGTRQFSSIDIQVLSDEEMLIVQQSRNSVRVTVRAQESVRNILLVDDITVTADLRGLGPGQHTVELEVEVARRASGDTIPAQVTVTLEQQAAKLVPVRADITAQPSQQFEAASPLFTPTDAEVDGPASLVEQVVAVQMALDLSASTTTYESEARVTPVDVDGEPVTGVSVDPQFVRVTVPISERSDVTRVFIEPDIGDALPEGYTIVDFDWQPRTLFVGGNVGSLPATLTTERISLAGQTGTYVVTVPVLLPPGFNDDDVLFLGESNVTVTVEIQAEISRVQFEGVPVTVIGLGDGLSAQVAPEQVTVQVTGSAVTLAGLSAEDISVVIDLNALAPGTYDLTPLVTSGLPGVETTSLPDLISVTITGQATPEVTPAVGP